MKSEEEALVHEERGLVHQPCQSESERKDISFVLDRIIILAFEVDFLWRRSAESDAKTNAARSVRMLSVSIPISQQLFVCEPLHIESELGK